MKILMAEITEIEKDRRILKEIATLEKAGHKVTVIGVTKKNKGLIRKDLTKNTNLILIPYKNVTPKGFFSKILRFLDQLIVTARLWIRVLTSTGFHVYHAHNAFTLPAMSVRSLLSRKPLIYDVHEVWWEIKAQLIDMGGLLERLFIKKATHIVTTSEKFDPILKDKYKLVSPVLPIPNYPSLGELKERSKKIISINDDNFPKISLVKLVYLGNVYANMTGLFNLLKAISSYENVQLHIYGYSSQGTMEKLIAETKSLSLENRVIFHDNVSSQSVLTSLKLYDIGIITYGWVNRPVSFKTYSTTKLYMYLHAALPILCSRIESYEKDFEQHNIMYWVDWDRIASFRSTIENIMEENVADFIQRKNRCLKVSERMVWEYQEDKLINLYKVIRSRS
jgi:glycosyltransferase involved in cell wall biosynthesis